MSSIRIYEDQAERIRRCKNASAVIQCAITRWKREELNDAMEHMPNSGNGRKLVLMALWKKPNGISDGKLRMILDAHYATPRASLLNALNEANLQVEELLASNRQKELTTCSSIENENGDEA